MTKPRTTAQAHPWRGVFPAITTQMHRDGSLDLESTASHTEALIDSGVAGIVFLGSLGENQTLSGEEKRLVMREMIAAVRGRVKVLSGVAEAATAEAALYTRDCGSRRSCTSMCT